MNETKFCKFCGAVIPFDAVICTKCGRQVEKIANDKNGIVINNMSSASSSSSSSSSSSAAASQTPAAHARKFVSKWTSFILCLFLGWLGGHKFYEGKTGLGGVYF